MSNPKCDYDKDPVCYCPRCLSIRIKSDIADYCYCDDCGSTRIETTTIEQWELLYRERYGHNFLDKF